MLKLVIVEDEANIRECLEGLFPWNLLEVTVAASFSNGQEAYKYLASRHADILLTDIRLPGMTGLDLVQMLRESGNQIPVIVLTGYRQFTYAQQAIRYQVNDFLLKPIKYEELASAVLRIKEQHLGTRSSAPDADSSASETAGMDSTYHEKIISLAKQYVNAHLADASLEGAALSVNLSTGYFSRLFHKITGITFQEWLTECRMVRAAELLREVHYKTYEVSLMVGYDNPKNFTRAFKQYYRITPREFRDQANFRKETPQ